MNELLVQVKSLERFEEVLTRSKSLSKTAKKIKRGRPLLSEPSKREVRGFEVRRGAKENTHSVSSLV